MFCNPFLLAYWSALEHSDVNAFIEQQLVVGYRSGTFPSLNCSGITNNLVVVPKKKPGKWQVIVNLSRPRNASVNDFIKREFTHVAYSSVDDPPQGPSMICTLLNPLSAASCMPQWSASGEGLPQQSFHSPVSYEGRTVQPTQPSSQS